MTLFLTVKPYRVFHGFLDGGNHKKDVVSVEMEIVERKRIVVIKIDVIKKVVLVFGGQT